MAFIVLLDANVIYPVTLRDVLLTAADADLYQLRLTERIVSEMSHAVTQNNPGANNEQNCRGNEPSLRRQVMTNDPKDRPSTASDYSRYSMKSQHA